MTDDDVEQEVTQIIGGIEHAIDGNTVECVIIALCETIINIHENSEPDLRDFIANTAEGMQTMINPKPAILLN